MPNTTSPAAYDARDWVTPEDLNVAPALLGLPLATPGRRLLAITVDVLIVATLSTLGNLWLVAGLALIVLMPLRARYTTDSRNRKLLVGLAAAALLAIGAQQAWTSRGIERTHELSAFDDGTAAPGLTPLQAAELRIEVLEARLLKASAPKPFNLREQVSDWIDEVGLGLGWAVVYFSLLPAWWNGQTVGKKLLRLRAVELTGKPITVMRAFKRYGGYAAGMATGLFGFAQVFWDPNRQAIQDKTAHTVVIDLRRKLAPSHLLPPSPEEPR